MILWVMIYMSSCAVGYSRSAGRAMIFVLRRRSRPDKPRVTALGAMIARALRLILWSPSSFDMTAGGARVKF